MTSFAPATPHHPSLDKLVSRLRTTKPLRVLCSPCSTTDEQFAVLALFPGDARPTWVKASCLAALSASADDVVQHPPFKSQFQTLYDDYGAVNVHETKGVVALEASLGDTTTATTARVYLLPEGDVVCFETQDWMPSPELSVVQRTGYAAARTFDVLLVRPRAPRRNDRALELRLVEKRRLPDVLEWGHDSNIATACSPGAPLSAHLLLRAFSDGSTVEEIVAAITGDDSCSESDSDVEWHESDESLDEDDETEEDDDSDFDVVAAEQELANLR